MPTPPSISLVVLYYEQPDEVKDLIGVLQNLARAPDEIIFVDDSSTRFALREEMIQIVGSHTRLVSTPENLGPVGAMNTGLQSATSDYVHFLACDDTVSPDFYAVAREHLASIRRTGIYSTNTRVTDDAGGDLGVYSLPQPAETPAFLSPGRAQDALFTRGSWFAGNATLFAAQPLHDMGGFDAALEEYADAFACYVLSTRWGAFFEPRALAVKRDPLSGRNMSIYHDPEKSRKICSAVIEKMGRDHADIFSAEFTRRFERRWRFNERTIGFYNSNAKLSGSKSLSPPAKIWLAVLFLIYRPSDLWRRLTRKHRPLGDFLH